MIPSVIKAVFYLGHNLECWNEILIIIVIIVFYNYETVVLKYIIRNEH